VAAGRLRRGRLRRAESRLEKRAADGALAVEEHALSMRGYFRHELEMLLERAGFRSVEVRGDHSDAAPSNEHDILGLHRHSVRPPRVTRRPPIRLPERAARR
jgi:hypothetical protein